MAFEISSVPLSLTIMRGRPPRLNDAIELVVVA